MEDVTMTIQPVFDMEEDDESEEISEHGKRENGKFSREISCKREIWNVVYKVVYKWEMFSWNCV